MSKLKQHAFDLIVKEEQERRANLVPRVDCEDLEKTFHALNTELVGLKDRLANAKQREESWREKAAEARERLEEQRVMASNYKKVTLSPRLQMMAQEQAKTVAVMEEGLAEAEDIHGRMKRLVENSKALLDEWTKRNGKKFEEAKAFVNLTTPPSKYSPARMGPKDFRNVGPERTAQDIAIDTVRGRTESRERNARREQLKD